MKLTDWMFGRSNDPMIELKLKSPAASHFEETSGSRVGLPRIPWPRLTADTTGRFLRNSELVYACIEKKAQAACDPELVVERRNRDDEWEIIPEHPAVALMRKPNPYEDGESFLRAMVASENTSGVFYAEKVLTRAGEIAELYPLIPSLIYPQTRQTANGSVLEYYSYMATNGTEIRFEPKDLLIRRRHSLGSVFSGLSPLQVALGTIDADIAATEYVRAFYMNDGTPSGILKASNRRLSEDEAHRILQGWMAKYGRGSSMRGAPALLDETLDYTPIGAKLSELNTDSLTSINEARICSAFGVPPILVGAYVGLLHVNQRASVREAQQDFWMNTMSPELKMIRHWMTWFILPYFEPYELVKSGDIRFNWDMSQVDALQEDVDSIHQRARDDYKAGLLTLNEARGYIRAEPLEGDEGELFYSPTPADAVAGLDTILNEKKKIEQPLTASLKADEPAPPAYDTWREPTPFEVAADYKGISEGYKSGTEALAKVVGQIRSDLIDQAIAAAAKLDASTIATLSLVPPSYADKAVGKVIKRVFEQGRRQIAAQAEAAGKSGAYSLDLEFKATDDEIWAKAYRLIIELTISRVINETASATVNIYTALGVLGMVWDELKEQLREQLNDRSDAPYLRIATQAVNRTMNEGRRAEMEAREEQIDRYVYSAILDNNTCDTCLEWDGFETTDLAEMPETPNVGCEGLGSCRCFTVTVFDEAKPTGD